MEEDEGEAEVFRAPPGSRSAGGCAFRWCYHRLPYDAPPGRREVVVTVGLNGLTGRGRVVRVQARMMKRTLGWLMLALMAPVCLAQETPAEEGEGAAEEDLPFLGTGSQLN